MAASVSLEQPFDAFLQNLDSHGTPPTLTNKDDVPETLLTDTPVSGNQPLSKDLQKVLDLGDRGPPSTRRSITRSHTAPELVSPTKTPTTAFERYKLDGPPKKSGSKKAETQGERLGRLEGNFGRLADVVAGLEGRYVKLMHLQANLVTEKQVRGDSSDLVPKSEDDPPVDDAASPSPSSVDGYDDDGDEVTACLDDLDQKIENLRHMTENQAADLEVVDRRTTRPFTIKQLSDAMKLQFTTIKKDRDAVIDLVESNASKQLQFNKTRDAKIAELESEVQRLGATQARMELAPHHPLPLLSRSRASYPEDSRFDSSSRVHSRSPSMRARSRSPVDVKRQRSAAHLERATTVVLGPITFGRGMTAESAFRLHMDTALPDYAADRQQFDITILGLSEADAEPLGGYEMCLHSDG
ncbi:hypothetical protein FB451DRAFT_1189469 [Mycena latifolia]|nr:hypothetical protein FB451DRAFT_1189469 [Mycena latifolia]